ncbi:hypothetical protein ABPG75_007740 [Micractinium tetrahymenae]
MATDAAAPAPALEGSEEGAALCLITGAQLFTPQPCGEERAILIGGGKILGLLSPEQAADLAAALPVQQLDASGLLAVPGFIDLHVHVCGGGGEAGPASRTPEAVLSQLLRAGITTVVGVTGTDSVSRSQENLVAKVQGLAADGITALHWCGAYRLPPATATGSVQRDLCLLESCVGVGEVAVSDHRGSAPSPEELARLALDARVGGMLSEKAGLVHCHMGPGAAGLQLLRAALAAAGGDMPIATFHPTHMGRSERLVQQGEGWLCDGGSLDVTCSPPEECKAALNRWRAAGVPLNSVTVSTDAYGSLPVFDERGKLVQYDVADPGEMLRFLRATVLGGGWPLERVLPLMTSNPARILKLPGKGRLAVGCDADVLLLEPATLELRYAFARGQLVLTPEWVRGGMFERGPGIRPRRPGAR